VRSRFTGLSEHISATNAADVVADADYIALWATPVREGCGVAGFRVTALGTCAVDVAESIFA
jgi:hypothetical protein